MTNTTPAAVSLSCTNCGEYAGTPIADHIDAISAQLEATNQRAEMMADSVAKVYAVAHAKGRADGLREAAGCIGHITRFEDLDAILALIHADTPVAPAKVPEVLHYTNWRGEVSTRSIIPHSVWYGTTQWHPDPQWFLRGFDTDKQAVRDFALADFGEVAGGHDE